MRYFCSLDHSVRADGPCQTMHCRDHANRQPRPLQLHRDRSAAASTGTSGCNQQNSIHAGGVEIFVHRGARVRYSSIENWSKNTYNLNTKRGLVDENGTLEWVSGNMGSGTTMLYPCSILRGRGARSDSLGVAFAGPGQNQDTGAKAIHTAPNTTSNIISKSISVNGGVNTFRGLIKIMPEATQVKAAMSCDFVNFDIVLAWVLF